MYRVRGKVLKMVHWFLVVCCIINVIFRNSNVRINLVKFTFESSVFQISLTGYGISVPLILLAIVTGALLFLTKKGFLWKNNTKHEIRTEKGQNVTRQAAEMRYFQWF